MAREKEPVLRANSIECLGRAFPTKKFRLSQAKFAISLTNLLSESMSAAVWRVRVSIITAMRLVLTKMDPSVEAVLPTFLNNATQILDIGHRDSKYHQVRGEVARVLLSIAKRAETDDRVKSMMLFSRKISGNLPELSQPILTQIHHRKAVKQGIYLGRFMAFECIARSKSI